MTLVEFLTARLAEDEAAARAATEGPWFVDAPDHAYVGNRADGRTYGLWAIVHMSGDVLRDLTDDAQRRTLADARHMARHDPARVLREVEAKRALLVEHALTGSTDQRAYDQGRWGHPKPPLALGCERCDDWDGWINGSNGCLTLRLMAAVYSDHPDYDEAWRPT